MEIIDNTKAKTCEMQYLKNDTFFKILGISKIFWLVEDGNIIDMNDAIIWDYSDFLDEFHLDDESRVTKVKATLSYEE